MWGGWRCLMARSQRLLRRLLGCLLQNLLHFRLLRLAGCQLAHLWHCLRRLGLRHFDCLGWAGSPHWSQERLSTHLRGRG